MKKFAVALLLVAFMASFGVGLMTTSASAAGSSGSCYLKCNLDTCLQELCCPGKGGYICIQQAIYCC